MKRLTSNPIYKPSPIKPGEATPLRGFTVSKNPPAPRFNRMVPILQSHMFNSSNHCSEIAHLSGNFKVVDANGYMERGQVENGTKVGIWDKYKQLPPPETGKAAGHEYIGPVDYS